jgi:hypothetical protein
MVGTPSGFFRYAEGAYIGDLIEEVRITVKKRDEHGGKVSFTQLSEGELQMLTVLGLGPVENQDSQVVRTVIQAPFLGGLDDSDGSDGRAVGEDGASLPGQEE